MAKFIDKLIKDNNDTNGVIQKIGAAIEGFDLQVVCDALGQVQNAAYAEACRLENEKYASKSEAEKIFNA